MDDPAHPVLLNTWKHHARWIRWRIQRAVEAGAAGVEALPRELLIVGTRLMDLYTGPLTPAEIGDHVLGELHSANRLDFSALEAWLQSLGEYALIELPDRSRWTIRLGPADGRYLHLHPGRWVPNTMRVQANTLKSAVMAHALARLTGRSAADLAVVNEARQRYLNLLPVRELTGDAGLGAVIGVLG